MENKFCIGCEQTKSTTEFYVNKGMKDGYLKLCRECKKKETREREIRLSADPSWVEKEKERHRAKYYRLGYKEKHKPSAEKKKEIMARYVEKYPEKKLAKHGSQRIETPSGHGHHWSYNKEHWTDVIDITMKDHAKAHRFLFYDQEQMMYRRTDNNELLDTRARHEEWIRWCIENKPD